MGNLFEDLIRGNSQITEGIKVPSTKRVIKKENLRKIKSSKLKIESMKVFDQGDMDQRKRFEDLDDQFAVDPSEESDEVVLVIDPELPAEGEVPEDAAEQMVGDYVYKCPICGANYVCDCDAAETESIEVDEDGVPTECPICGDEAEQILVGEIAPAESVESSEDEGEMEPVEVKEDEEEVEDEVEEKVEEACSNKKFGRKHAKDLAEEKDKSVVKINTESAKLGKYVIRSGVSAANPYTREYSKKTGKHFGYLGYGGRSWVPIDSEGIMTFDSVEEANAAAKKHVKSKYKAEIVKVTESSYSESLKEDIGQEVDKYQMWVDYDMKHYKKISDETNDLLAKAGLEVVKDDHGDYEVIAKSKDESLHEDIDVTDTDICPECGTDPRVCEDQVLELADPVEEKDKSAVKIDTDVVNLTIDDVRLESLMNKVIKENYKGNNKFKVVKAYIREGKLNIDYCVGKSMKGTLIAEGFDKKSRRMTLRVRDKGIFTESISKTPSFIIECVRLKNKVVPTSIKYNYKVKVNESLYRVKGKVDFSGRKLKESTNLNENTIWRRKEEPRIEFRDYLSTASLENLFNDEFADILPNYLPMSESYYEMSQEYFDAMKKRISDLISGKRPLVNPENKEIIEDMWYVIRTLNSPDELLVV